LDTTAHLDTSVEAFEADVVEGAVGMTIAKVLDPLPHAGRTKKVG
jgi:hypothetical protein